MAHTSLIGKVLGKYQVVDSLGRGGMAEVFKAYQESLDRYVAIKVMHSFLADEQNFLTRFKREARAMAALNHNNIVVVYDFDIQSGLYYIVMEFVGGGTLKERLTQLSEAGEHLPLPQVIRLVLEIADALAYAHERDMVHRDIKPGNIMLDAGGHAVLTDFGIAKIMSGPSVTATGAMIGTPAYMSPEQGLGRPGDERSDLYALGVLFYHMATGRLPYEADTPLAVILKHVNQPIPEPGDFVDDMPQAVRDVIVKAMAKEPDKRYQTAREFSEDLRLAAAESGIDLARVKAKAIMPVIEDEVVSPPPTPAPVVTAAEDAIEPTMVSPDSSISGTREAASQGAMAGANTVLGDIAAETRVAPFEPVEQTEVAMPAPPMRPTGETGQAPVVAPAPAAEEKKRRPMGLIIGIVAILLLAVGGFAAFSVLSGGDDEPTQTPEATEAVAAVNTETPEPTDTPEPESTVQPSPTVNIQLTTDSAVAATLAAAAAAQPSATPEPSLTPDLAATADAACEYDVELLDSYPYNNPNFNSATAGRQFPMSWEIRNRGTCPIPAGTEWTYLEGESFGDAGPVVLEEELAPGDEVTLSTTLRAPTGSGQVESTWQLIGPDGRLYGDPLTFRLSILTPTPTSPPVTVAPTPTPTPEGPVQALNFNLGVDTGGCQYEGANWTCPLFIEPYGGRPPYVVLVAISDPPTRFEGDGPFRVDMLSGRCNAWVHNIAVEDSSGQRTSRDVFYDPDNLFAGGCTQP